MLYSPSAYVMQPNSGLLRLDAKTHVACQDGEGKKSMFCLFLRRLYDEV